MEELSEVTLERLINGSSEGDMAVSDNKRDNEERKEEKEGEKEGDELTVRCPSLMRNVDGSLTCHHWPEAWKLNVEQMRIRGGGEHQSQFPRVRKNIRWHCDFVLVRGRAKGIAVV